MFLLMKINLLMLIGAIAAVVVPFVLSLLVLVVPVVVVPWAIYQISKGPGAPKSGDVVRQTGPNTPPQVFQVTPA
ncbi:hypothetical protein LCGC14_0364270 [marine sediment metagenome]|uniref:Uncharacterized protein n=1 Tax=marine sediment metagenome TaxID=412755 RepID=A0A0F9WFM1_9ZZZZ